MTAAEVAGVEISKPDKVLFPAGTGGKAVTKLDLATYYDAIADVMLPHLRGRPINMQRFPDGIDGMAFYEKKVPSHFPDWVHTRRGAHRGRDAAPGRGRRPPEPRLPRPAGLHHAAHLAVHDEEASRSPTS